MIDFLRWPRARHKSSRPQSHQCFYAWVPQCRSTFLCIFQKVTTTKACGILIVQHSAGCYKACPSGWDMHRPVDPQNKPRCLPDYITLVKKCSFTRYRNTRGAVMNKRWRCWILQSKPATCKLAMFDDAIQYTKIGALREIHILRYKYCDTHTACSTYS